MKTIREVLDISLICVLVNAACVIWLITLKGSIPSELWLTGVLVNVVACLFNIFIVYFKRKARNKANG